MLEDGAREPSVHTGSSSGRPAISARTAPRRRAIAPYGLELVGGFAPLHLADEDAYRAELPVWLDPIIDVLAETGRRGPVVLADAETDERIAAAAGQPGEQVRDGALRRCVRTRARARERGRRAVHGAGVDVVFHHHAATYVETADELERFLAGTDVGICFDTGHALVGSPTRSSSCASADHASGTCT